MAPITPDLPQQFADFFPEPAVRPLARYLMAGMIDGHICLALKEADKGDWSDGHGGVRSELARQWIATGEEALNKPFVLHDGMLYLQRYYRYESSIVSLIRQRIERSAQEWEERSGHLLTRLIPDAFPTRAEGADGVAGGVAGGEQVDWQMAAVIRTLCSYFSIITGGPGTGKTTTLVRLMEGIYTLNPDARVALAAPTGKASMRMLESIKDRSAHLPPQLCRQLLEAKPYTLQRLLGYIPNSIYFKFNHQRPLPYDWVVVDEASMVDVALFAKLLQACGPETRLVLLGDKDQLASVESGSLMGDLCAAAGELNRYSGAERELINQFITPGRRLPGADLEPTSPTLMGSCITELRFSHRFHSGSGVGRLARAVLAGEGEEAVELLRNHRGIAGLTWYEDAGQSGWEKVLEDILQGYQAYAEEEDIASALRLFRQYRVLTPVREGEQGLHTLNLKIGEGLRKRRLVEGRPAAVFYHNQPVMVTKNDYSLGLFNGDVGLVRLDSSRQLRVWFESSEQDGALRSFHPSAIGSCETAYAMTIHKSQGSEFDRVLVVLPQQEEHRLITRELLYTAITRAREEVLVWGPEAVLRAGIERRIKRISGLEARLR